MVLPDSDGFLVSRRTQDAARYQDYFEYEAFTSLADLPKSFFYNLWVTHRSPTTPRVNSWFALLPFRSPLLRQSFLLSLPAAT